MSEGETRENLVRDLCRSDKENESIVGGLAIVTREPWRGLGGGGGLGNRT